MKYTTKTKKEEILNIIINEFERVKKDLKTETSDFNYGRYEAIMDILQKVEIYEKED